MKTIFRKNERCDAMPGYPNGNKKEEENEVDYALSLITLRMPAQQLWGIS